MLRRAAFGLLATLVAVLGPLGGPAAAAPGDPDPGGRLGIQLLEAPIDARDDPRALIYIVDSLPPGTTIERRIRVTNLSDAPIQVALYPAAASVSGGEFRFADARTVNDLTAWMSVTPDAANLPAGGTSDGLVRIAVPTAATGAERYAVVWAEVSTAPADGQVREVNRVGIRVYLAVSGEPQASDFRIDSIAGERGGSGVPVVTTKVTNTGGRAVDVSGTVTLSDGPGGVSVDPASTEQTLTLAPGESGEVSAAFDPALADGPWQVVVRLASGTVEREAAAQLSFTADPDVVPVDSSASSSWWWIGGIIALALLVLAVAWLRRRSPAAA